MKDYLAMNDDDLRSFAAVFAAGVADLTGTIDFPAAEAAQLTATLAEFKDLLAEIETARNHQQSLNSSMLETRGRLKQTIRGLAAAARTSNNGSADNLTRLGLKIHDRTRTPISAPENAPTVSIAIEQNRRHVISVFNPAQSQTRAKPKDVSGAEIWVYVAAGDEEFDEKKLRYIGTATRHQMIHDFAPEDAGKPAIYQARWVNRRGMRGTWSRPVRATIAV